MDRDTESAGLHHLCGTDGQHHVPGLTVLELAEHQISGPYVRATDMGVHRCELLLGGAREMHTRVRP